MFVFAIIFLVCQVVLQDQLDGYPDRDTGDPGGSDKPGDAEPIVQFQGENSRSRELVTRYILQSMKIWLQDDHEKAAAENYRFVYSFPFLRSGHQVH